MFHGQGSRENNTSGRSTSKKGKPIRVGRVELHNLVEEDEGHGRTTKRGARMAAVRLCRHVGGQTAQRVHALHIDIAISHVGRKQMHEEQRDPG
jgi:hypothetical protein